MRKLGTIVLVGALAAVLVAAAQGAGRPAVVKLRSTGLGKVLVDAQGRTLYLFEADRHGRSACYGACATAWPPLLTRGRPKAAAGIRTGLLGTTKRRDGRLQVTYRGHPLYVFLRDTAAGQTNGEDIDGFGGKWYVLDAAGTKVEARPAAAPAPSATTTSAGTSPGYGGYGG